MNTYSQKSASIQTRTSPPQFGKVWQKYISKNAFLSSRAMGHNLIAFGAEDLTDHGAIAPHHDRQEAGKEDPTGDAESQFGV